MYLTDFCVVVYGIVLTDFELSIDQGPSFCKCSDLSTNFHKSDWFFNAQQHMD